MNLTRNLAFTLIIVGCSIIAYSIHVDANELKQGKTYHGFKLIKVQDIPEIDCKGFLFEHQLSGARLFKLKNGDENKTFAITFSTPPPDDTGLPHILEHSVLAGSRKFPTKDPWMTMLKGTLSSDVNAITSGTYTQYTFTTHNSKEFFNLMDVHLDMVFYPLIYERPQTFLQEGWRYELADKDADLVYNGVVYNEMKGRSSWPDLPLYRAVYKSLFPDNQYSNNAVGYPPEIPNLTREALLSYHKRYYHPSNSYIHLYGNGDTLAELKFINAEYLVNFKRSTKSRGITAKHQPLLAMKHVTTQYSVEKTENTKDKTMLALAFVVDGTKKPGFSISMSILADALVNQRSAPIRQALEKAGIGKDMSASYYNLLQGVFIIEVKNANPKDKDKFKQAVFSTLRAVAKNGLNKRDLEGILNRKEFELREADRRGYTKGMNYIGWSLNTWMYANDPFQALNFEANLAHARQMLSSRQLANLLQSQLIDNPYAVIATNQPKPGLGEENAKRLKTLLSKKKASLTPKQIQDLVKQTKELKAYQKQPDRPEDIAKIPILNINDLAPKAAKLNLSEEQINGVSVLHHQAQTNGIVYLQLLFDTSVVPKEMIPYVTVLTKIMGKLDTDKYSYTELASELNTHTGGLSFLQELYIDAKNPDKFYPRLVVNAKVFPAKLAKLIELAGQIIGKTRYSDKNKLAKILHKIDADNQIKAKMYSHSLSVYRLHSNLSLHGYYRELTQGLSQIHFTSKLLKNYKKDANDLFADLELVASLIFNLKNLQIGVTCSASDYQNVKKHLPNLIAYLGSKQPKMQPYDFPNIASKKEGLLSASEVSHVVQGANYKQLGYKYSGKLKVLERILTSEFLFKKIREQGGAYGAWSSFSRSGTGYMMSYQDPDLDRTLRVYKKSVDFLNSFSTDKREMTRFIIGTIGRLDRAMTPSAKGRRAVAHHIEGWTYQDQQRERNEILATTKTDIQAYAKLLKDMVQQNSVCVYSNQQKLSEQKTTFDKFTKIFE